MIRKLAVWLKMLVEKPDYSPDPGCGNPWICIATAED
jgi:hypothetical protein